MKQTPELLSEFLRFGATCGARKHPIAMATVADIKWIARWSLSLLAALLWIGSAWAAETGFLARSYTDADGEHRYAVYVPHGYQSGQKWPVVLYLHGAGASGTDGQQQLGDGLAAVIRAEGNFPAIVVLPQCENVDAPLLTRWLADSPDGQRALRILDAVEHDFSIDPARRILTGWSMGGYGAWSLAAVEPEHWAAVVPVSGGGNPELAAQIKSPVWAIHGAADRAIPAQRSHDMVDAVNHAGGRASLTELASVGHDAWRYAFSSPAVRQWMLSSGTTAPDTAALTREAAEFESSGQAEALDGEFKPALVIPRAVSIRVGNDALNTLGCGAPQAVDQSLLSGPIEDLTFDFTAAGEAFQITQEEIRFAATLDRILAETDSNGLICFRVALKRLTITIGATHVRGATHSADAGPFDIQMGVRYPIWIEVRLRPTVSDGQLRFSIVRSDFQIPDANWYVTTPKDVTVSGPGLTADLAQIALVGGIYKRRPQIEQCVRDALPRIVESLERRMQPTSVNRIVASVWPLPVFRPRLRLQADEVSVDGDGLTLVLGLTAAAFKSQPAPEQPRVTQPMGPHAVDVPRSRNLELGIAPEVLQELSGMMVAANAAQIDVRDMPEPEFAALANRQELNTILPALAPRGDAVQVRTVLNLAAPLVVERAELAGSLQFTSTAPNASSIVAPSAPNLPAEPAPAEVSAHFEIPRLLVTVLTRDAAGSSDWQRFAEFDVRLMQSASVRLTAEGHQRRTVHLGWTGAPDVAVAGAYIGAPSNEDAGIDRDRLAKLVENCWLAWTGGEEGNEDVPDLVLGSAHLRINSIAWRGSELVASYNTPEIRITNSGSRLIDYAVRRPFSDWSPRRQLKPGASDLYESPSALIVRRYPQPVQSAITVPVGGELDLAGSAK
jgi:poly(3-hydroxybutyrate) depolymerase